MRLLAPAGRLSNAKIMLDAGADDLYLGAYAPSLQIYSFNGRSAYSKSGEKIQPDYDELKEIVQMAHERGANVAFLANIPFINDSYTIRENSEKNIVRMFEEYIQRAVETGVDSIVVGDIGALVILKRLNLNIPIVASAYMEVLNSDAVEFLSEIGVEQIILSYQASLEDIKAITKKTPLKIEVFGHGGCSFYLGACSLFHSVGESGVQGIDVGYPCRGMYCISQDGKQIGRERFLDGFKMCSFCQLSDLIHAKVHMLKIVGRDLDIEFLSKVIEIYRMGIDMAKAGIDLKKQANEILPLWWKKMYCDLGKRCRHQ